MLCLVVLGALSLTAFACGRADQPNDATVYERELVPLTEGCYPLVLTWPAGTALETVVAAITRPDALDVILRHDPATGRTLGYTREPERRTEYLRTETDHDQVQICMRTASMIQRPRREGPAQESSEQLALAPLRLAPPATSAERPAPAASPEGTEASVTPPVPEEARHIPATLEAEVDPRMPHTLLAPGAPLPKETRCAAVVERASWEPRPENFEANHTRGTPLASAPLPGLDAARVTGNFTGTTDEIIRWGACKWGWDPDIVRAIAVQESNWKQAAIGDLGTSFGLLQIKRTAHVGTYPSSQKSTAFNVDYTLAWLRACYDGRFGYWLPSLARGDEWGCVGTWYSGNYRDTGAQMYITLIKRHLAEKPWSTPRF